MWFRKPRLRYMPYLIGVKKGRKKLRGTINLNSLTYFLYYLRMFQLGNSLMHRFLLDNTSHLDKYLLSLHL